MRRPVHDVGIEQWGLGWLFPFAAVGIGWSLIIFGVAVSCGAV